MLGLQFFKLLDHEITDRRIILHEVSEARDSFSQGCKLGRKLVTVQAGELPELELRVK